MAVSSVRSIGPDGGVARHDVGDLAALLADPGAGWVWVDVPEPDERTAALLTDVLDVHPAAAADGLSRNHVARLHHYADVLYLALHRPCPGERGHVHYLELDLYVAPGFLVTLHGPRNPSVGLGELLRETEDVAARLEAGRLHPAGPLALAYSLVSALTNAQERIVNEFAQQVGLLEQRVMARADDDRPQDFLDELFTVRHTLLTVRTMASQGAEVLGRAATLEGRGDDGGAALLDDLRDQYHRLARITHSQLEFLQGVTDFYRARTDTRMLVAAERLAVIAAVTLPVAAVSGVFGMNLIVNDATRWWELTLVVAAMLGTSLWLLRWARRQGWW
ncbi:magnesium transporter CorA family protein [Phycicoccus sonneratiae]|uniref:Magnesium transporter CorA family protein n=1 Tax=Phycicoccus sonneratiae TaxID=2807628 RepID=A0ABS2CHZ9_9MICO|nr:magnesium transporter CorA family protein [Phycicoccus sonneraticus]MBM6399500.1 magnesium transporter CorA family protein [Phycicoccus sonneraticus]